MTRQVLYAVLAFSFIFFQCKKKADKVEITAGVVTALKGDVKIIDPAGKEKATALLSYVSLKDTIITGKDGSIDLQIRDSIVFRLKQNTKVMLSEMVTKADGNFTSKLELTKGRVFSKTLKKLSPDTDFKVVTKTSVAGVRGTEFMVIEEDGLSETMVSEGSVSYTDTSDGEEVVIDENKKGILEDGKISTNPLTSDELNSLKEESKSIVQLAEEEKARIMQYLEDQRAVNAEILQNQKDINNQELQNQKDRNNTELQDLKDKNQQMLDEQKAINNQEKQNVIDNTEADKNQIKGKTVDDKNSIKSGTEDQMNDIKSNKNLKDQIMPK